MFDELMLHAAGEVSRRIPNYLVDHPPQLPTDAGAVSGRLHAAAAALHVDLSDVLSRYGDWLTRRGIRPATQSPALNRVDHVLIASAIDAAAAESGTLALRSHTPCDALPAEVLACDYREAALPGGARYWVRRHGTRPLLVVNAVGVSLGLWRQLLTDRAHDFQLVFLVGRMAGSDGQMRSACAAEVEALDLLAILEQERLSHATCLAWCNGVRIVLEALGRCPHAFESLVLLAPTFKDASANARGSDFEENALRMFHILEHQPRAAPMLSKMLVASTGFAPDSRTPLSGSDGRERRLFGLPSADTRPELLAPMLTPESLAFYAERARVDERCATHALLRRNDVATMVVVGSDDATANNESTRRAVRDSGRSIQIATIEGAGHYVQDLQYPYLRALIEQWIGGVGATPTARVMLD